MNIKVVKDEISIDEVKELAQEFYKILIKGVVDVEQEILALGGEYHMDANDVLIDQGSKQANVWGFNLKFDEPEEEWIEYISLINIRPSQGNRQMELMDKDLRKRIKEIITKKVKK